MSDDPKHFPAPPRAADPPAKREGVDPHLSPVPDLRLTPPHPDLYSSYVSVEAARMADLADRLAYRAAMRHWAAILEGERGPK